VACIDHIDRIDQVRNDLVELQEHPNLSSFFQRIKPSEFYDTCCNHATTAKGDEKIFIALFAWSEYFNSFRKCWEPLCEKIRAQVMFEQVGILSCVFHSITIV
jgi:hypothetical protein